MARLLYDAAKEGIQPGYVRRLTAEGMSNEDIGEKLFISVHAVKVHTRNIYAKLDTQNRTEAVARARNYGILTLD